MKRIAAAAVFLCGVAGCSDDPSPTRFVTIDDLPECDAEKPSFECINKLYLPLRATEWPFDRAAVDLAYEANATEVAPGWKLTALHVIDARAPATEPADCHAAAFEFAPPGGSIERPGCGTFLFLGGHPQSVACRVTGQKLNTCVDTVPIAETFDIGLVRGAPTGGLLEVRTDVQEGEDVFVLGEPTFLPLLKSSSEAELIAARQPLVSSGKVLKLDGRGMVLSNAVSFGNSGGPVLDRAGRVVGVVYTLLRHLRLAGTPTDPALASHRSIAVRIDAAMKVRIDAEVSASRAR